MQDFTQFIATNNESLSQAKQDKWLTKDRLWNLVFWFGMSLGLSISLTIAMNGKNTNTFSYWSTVFFWLTILGVPLLVRYFAKTTFVKDTIFLTSEGREFDITKNFPNKFLTIVSTFALVALTGVILDKKLLHISDSASFFIFTIIVFGVPTLFFIYKNCPISILFNSNFWKLRLSQEDLDLEAEGNYIKRSNYHSSTLSSSSRRLSSSDYITNPSYGGLDSNIYNRHR